MNPSLTAPFVPPRRRLAARTSLRLGRGRAARALGIVTLFASVGAYTPSSFAQPASGGSENLDAAREHFQRGVDLYKERDFDAALVEFTRAHALASNYKVLFNLGQVEVERHDYVAAIKHFNDYLDAGKDAIPSDRRKQVESDIQSLKRRVVELRIKCNVSSAEILVDNVVVGKTPLSEPLLLNAGVLQVSVRKPGYAGEARRLTLAGGETQDVTFELRPEGEESAPLATTPPSSAAPPPRAEHRASSAPFWIGLTATGVLAAGAGTFGYLALRSNQDLDRSLGAFPSDPQRIDTARRELKRDALIADLLGGAAVVAGGITLYFALSTSSPSERASRASLELRVRGRGVDLAGHF
jgi:tetratricopeptide (TPR) repeat protein